jgi:hypothetical protein
MRAPPNVPASNSSVCNWDSSAFAATTSATKVAKHQKASATHHVVATAVLCAVVLQLPPETASTPSHPQHSIPPELIDAHLEHL